MENTCKNIIKQKNSQKLKNNSFYIQKSKQNLNDFKFSQWDTKDVKKNRSRGSRWSSFYTPRGHQKSKNILEIH
jgi:hypothetical protein